MIPNPPLFLGIVLTPVWDLRSPTSPSRELNKSRAWAVLCVPPPTQTPGTLADPCGAQEMQSRFSSRAVGWGRRGGTPSATHSVTGTSHRWLIPPFPAFFFSKCLCPPIILCSGFQVQNKLPSQPSSYISSEHLTNCDEHNLPKITPVAGFALLGPSSSLWRTFPKLFGAYWLEGLQKKCLWVSPDANLLFD